MFLWGYYFKLYGYRCGGELYLGSVVRSVYGSLSFRLAVASVFAALVAVVTYVTSVPLGWGATFNLGEAFIFVGALLFGPFVGLFAGVGAVIADALLAPSYVFVTPLVKGLEGFFVGYLVRVFNRRIKSLTLCVLVAVLFGGFVMVGGYFMYELVMWGYVYALSGLLFNVVQMLAGLIVAVPVMYTVLRVFPQFKSYI